MHEWEKLFTERLQDAQNSRELGNEGRARVSARRAAAVVIYEYYRRNDPEILASIPESALDQIKFFISQPLTKEEFRTIGKNFLIRVSTDHSLPAGTDLIADAKFLRESLL